MSYTLPKAIEGPPPTAVFDDDDSDVIYMSKLVYPTIGKARYAAYKEFGGSIFFPDCYNADLVFMRPAEPAEIAAGEAEEGFWMIGKREHPLAVPYYRVRQRW